MRARTYNDFEKLARRAGAENKQPWSAYERIETGGSDSIFDPPMTHDMYGMEYKGHIVRLTHEQGLVEGGRWNVQIDGNPLTQRFGMTYENAVRYVTHCLG